MRFTPQEPWENKMAERQLLIYNARLVDASLDKKGALLIKGGKIHSLLNSEQSRKLLNQEGIDKFDAKGLVLLPSFIDMHAHFRDPGQTQKEDIASGCAAAAAGGFGTLVLMPNTAPVVSLQKEAQANDKKAEQTGLAHVIQSVSITSRFDGSTISHLNELNKSIVPLITEDGHEVTDSSVMLSAMKIAAKKGLIVSCHSEDPFLAQAARPLRKAALELLKKNKGNPSPEQKKEAAAYLRQADALLAAAEDAATYRNIRLAELAGCHVHLCHVSTRQSLQAVIDAKKRGVNVTCEITPHHIGLSSKGTNVFNIVNPPLRSEEDRLFLIQALKKGDADVIATDHAPHTMQDKADGSPGFSGLETAFAVCNTTLVKENGFTLKRLSELMSAKPAALLGLKKRGLLAEGYEADLTLVDPERIWTVRGENFASKGKFTPLEGKKLAGQIQASFLSGKLVFEKFN